MRFKRGSIYYADNILHLHLRRLTTCYYVSRIYFTSSRVLHMK